MVFSFRFYGAGIETVICTSESLKGKTGIYSPNCKVIGNQITLPVELERVMLKNKPAPDGSMDGSILNYLHDPFP